MKYLNDNKQDKSVWNLGVCQGSERIKDSDGTKIHNTQKPEDLLIKVILSSTKPGSIILDPFFGTGTTGAVARKYGRHYIGIDRDDEDKYLPAARKRIDAVVDESNDITNLSLEVKPPKVSMKKLIEAQLIIPGECIYNANSLCIGTITDNGNVLNDDAELSIHKATAKMLNKASANGWDYLFVKRNDTLVSINDFRYQR